MDEFQATPPEELRRLRALSAQEYGDRFLAEAVRLLHERCGAQAMDELRVRIAGQIREFPDHSGRDDRSARLAMEELYRVLQLAATGTSALRGWTEGAPPSTAEKRS